MVPVAVGAFENEGVGLGEGFELLEDGGVDGAEVSGEDDAFSGGAFVNEELKTGGAEHVSGFGPDDFDAGSDGNGLAVGDGFEVGEDGFDVVGGVEWGFVGMAAASVAFVLAFGVGGLDSGGVAEDEAGEFDGGWGGPDGAAEVGLSEERESSDVIEVGVGDEDGVGRSVAQPGEIAIQFIGTAAALEKATVDEEAGGVVLEEVAGAGDFASGGAEWCDGEHGVGWGGAVGMGLRIGHLVLPANGADDEVGFEGFGMFVFGRKIFDEKVG